MLDVHCITGVPGAATVLGANFPTICLGGDGQSVAGVPIADNAILSMYGGLSIAANTIGAIKLQSQDQIDPINGETWTTGAASLLNLVHKYTKLPYKTGVRAITMGTNTGVGAASAYLIDAYPGGNTIAGNKFMPNQIITGATTFGGALTIHQWSSQPYTPGTAIPNGKYAILGAYASAMSYGGVLRFQHADFGQFMPGFPVSNYETVSTSTWDKIMKDDLFTSFPGYQFVYLSDIMGTPVCPVFTVSNAGTGLIIWALSAVADTPVVHLNIAKVA